MGPEIAQQWVVDAAQAVCPGFDAWDMVDADAQDLGIQSRKLGLFGFVRRDLAGSYRSPGLREKRQNDVRSTQLSQGDLTIQMAG